MIPRRYTLVFLVEVLDEVAVDGEGVVIDALQGGVTVTVKDNYKLCKSSTSI